MAQENSLVTEVANFYASDFFVSPNSGNHEGHFNNNLFATSSLVTVMTSIASQATTYPIGSSSGGFTYVRNAQGLPVPASETYGPVLAERALTLGKGNLNFGLSVIHASFDDFQGLSLDGGDLDFVLTHFDVNSDGDTTIPDFEGDVIDTKVFLDLNRTESVFFFNYGITDRLDLGIVLPFVQVDLESTVDVHITRLGTAVDPTGGNQTTPFHGFQTAFPPPRCTIIDELNCREFVDSSESGIGDVILRGKINVYNKNITALAASLDVRLPTGDEEDLLGLGATQAAAQFIGSWNLANDRISPHFNAGYTATFGDYTVTLVTGASTLVEPPDEANLTVGTDFSITERLTLAADLIGRRFFDAGTAVSVPTVFEFDSDNTVAGIQLDQVVLPQVNPIVEDIDSYLAAFGAKIHVGKKILLNASILAPFGSDDGLQDDLSFFIGIDFNR